MLVVLVFVTTDSLALLINNFLTSINQHLTNKTPKNQHQPASNQHQNQHQPASTSINQHQKQHLKIAVTLVITKYQHYQHLKIKLFYLS
jgi:hypothetical protein